MSFDISVIVPYFNGSMYIERCLASIESQSLKPLEILVIDDGSSIGETNFLKDLVTSETIRVIRKENGGQGSARNLGARQSTGEFIAFLDQDDYFLPKHLETLRNVLMGESADVAYAYGDVCRTDEKGNVVSLSTLSPLHDHPIQDLRQMLKNDLMILPSATLFRRESFLEIGGFDEQFRGYEDDDIFIRANLAGMKNAYTPELVTAWTINLASTSYSDSMFESAARFVRKYSYSKDLDDRLGEEAFGTHLFPRFRYLHLFRLVQAAGLNLPSNPRVRNYKMYSSLVGQSKVLPWRVKSTFFLARALTKPACWNLFKLLFVPCFKLARRLPQTIKEFLAAVIRTWLR